MYRLKVTSTENNSSGNGLIDYVLICLSVARSDLALMVSGLYNYIFTKCRMCRVILSRSHG